MRYFKLILLLVCCTVSAFGQSTQTTDDTSAFKQYLSHTFAQYYPMSVLQRMYRYMNAYSKDTISNRYVVTESNENFGWAVADMPAEGPISFATPATYMVGKEQGFRSGYRHYDDKAFPDTLQYVFKLAHSDFRSQYPKRRVAEQELVKNLTAFSKAAHNKPLFFAEIHQKYDDDITTYVKDIFSKSILVNEKHYQRFLRKPSVEKLQNDMGVRFVISMAMYELWLKQESEK